MRGELADDLPQLGPGLVDQPVHAVGRVQQQGHLDLGCGRLLLVLGLNDCRQAHRQHASTEIQPYRFFAPTMISPPVLAARNQRPRKRDRYSIIVTLSDPWSTKRNRTIRAGY